jgi:hypothetical protein
MKASLIATLRNNPKIGNRAADVVAQLEKQGRLDAVLGEGVRGAKAGKGAAERVLTKTQEEHQTLFTRLSDVETGWGTKASLEQTEKLGKQIFGEEVWKEQGDVISGFAKGLGGAAVGALVGLVQKKPAEEILKMYEDAYGPLTTDAQKKSYSKFLTGVKKHYADLPAGMREALSKVTKGTSLTDVARFAERPKLDAMTESVKGYITKMGIAVDTTGKDITDPFALASLYKSEDIAGLEAEGRGTQKGEFGRFLRETKGFAGLTGKERARRQAEGAGILSGLMGPEGMVSKESAFAPSGTEAERLGQGDKAVTAAQAQFTTIMQKFGPSVDKFNKASDHYIEAARELKEAAPLIKAAVESK